MDTYLESFEGDRVSIKSALNLMLHQEFSLPHLICPTFNIGILFSLDQLELEVKIWVEEGCQTINIFVSP